jgi:hypothetical protein
MTTDGAIELLTIHSIQYSADGYTNVRERRTCAIGCSAYVVSHYNHDATDESSLELENFARSGLGLNPPLEKLLQVISRRTRHPGTEN